MGQTGRASVHGGISGNQLRSCEGWALPKSHATIRRAAEQKGICKRFDLLFPLSVVRCTASRIKNCQFTQHKSRAATRLSSSNPFCLQVYQTLFANPFCLSLSNPSCLSLSGPFCCATRYFLGRAIPKMGSGGVVRSGTEVRVKRHFRSRRQMQPPLPRPLHLMA